MADMMKMMRKNPGMMAKMAGAMGFGGGAMGGAGGPSTDELAAMQKELQGLDPAALAQLPKDVQEFTRRHCLTLAKAVARCRLYLGLAADCRASEDRDCPDFLDFRKDHSGQKDDDKISRCPPECGDQGHITH